MPSVSADMVISARILYGQSTPPLLIVLPALLTALWKSWLCIIFIHHTDIYVEVLPDRQLGRKVEISVVHMPHCMLQAVRRTYQYDLPTTLKLYASQPPPSRHSSCDC